MMRTKGIKCFITEIFSQLETGKINDYVKISIKAKRITKIN